MLEEMPADVPEPRVHANQDQWNLIARELYDRHLVEPVGKPVELRGKPLVNGAFAVVKPNNFLEDERAVLRLIMDFRGTNAGRCNLPRSRESPDSGGAGSRMSPAECNALAGM